MPSPRPSKDEPRSPEALTVAGGGSAVNDKLNDIYQQLGKLQSQVTYLEASADEARKELRAISTNIIEWTATFRTLKWVVSIVGAVVLALWGVIATFVGMMAKHYLGW